MAQATPITFPIGRHVAGSLYNGRTTDADGNPLVYKSGDKKGQPRTEWSFGVAFPKVPGQHWASSEWGAVLWQVGHAYKPNAGNMRDFSWKVLDGDDQQVNKKGKRNCDRPGWAGHWVVFFSSSVSAPEIWNADGSVRLTQPDLIKGGYYIQVAGDVAANNSEQNPGIYVNHRFVAFAGVCPDDQIITFGPDVGSVGFGQNTQAPAGMLAVPATAAQAAGLGNAAPPPPPPGAAPAPAPAPAPAAYAPPPAPVAVAPNPGMTAVPAPLAHAGVATPPPGAPAATPAPAPTPPSAPPAPISHSSGPQLTAKAVQEGQTYEGLKGAGWTDDVMRQHGYIV